MSEPISPDLPRWRQLRAALDEFRSYLAHHVPRFTVLAACDYWTDMAEYNRLRPTGFPSKLRGVYLIYGPSETLLYVGVALRNFDKRVWAHKKLFASHGVERRWTDVIALEAGFAFLAPSLEYYLICRLRPLCNTAYSRNEIPLIGGGV